jgi:hypothetical protein
LADWPQYLQFEISLKRPRRCEWFNRVDITIYQFQISTTRRILEDIDQLHAYIRTGSPPKEDKEQILGRLSTVHHLLLVYQTELLAEIEEWDRLLARVQVPKPHFDVASTHYLNAGSQHNGQHLDHHDGSNCGYFGNEQS